jgi:hypothetical protein
LLQNSKRRPTLKKLSHHLNLTLAIVKTSNCKN